MKKFLVLVGQDSGCHFDKFYCVTAESKSQANEKIHKYYDDDIGWGIVENQLYIWEEGEKISIIIFQTPALDLSTCKATEEPFPIRSLRGVWREDFD